METIGGYIGSNLGLEYPAFEDALKQRGIAYQERTISDALGLYELAYQYDGQARYAYVRATRYDIDGFGQDVYVFSRALPDARVLALVEALG